MNSEEHAPGPEAAHAVPATLRPFYADWAGYQRRWVDGIRRLTPDDLELRVPADRGYPTEPWPLWAVIAHTVAPRVFWLCDVFGEPGAEETPFPGDTPGWEDDLTQPRSVDELVWAWESTWRLIEGCLDRWTPDSLDVTARREEAGRPAEIHALVRHFVRINMPAVIPVELRDIGPAATKYLEDIGQNLVDRLVDGTNMKERKQRMRNIVQPIKKRIHPLDRAKIDRQSLPFADFLGISRNNQPLVGCRFPAQDLPAEPHLTPGTTQRKNLLGGEQARIRGHQAFERSPERLSDRLQKTVVTDLGLLSSYRLTEIIGQQKNPSGHIYFPPPDLRIPQYLLQHGFTSHYPLIVNLYHN